jgi:hypothetical protein
MKSVSATVHPERPWVSRETMPATAEASRGYCAFASGEEVALTMFAVDVGGIEVGGGQFC